MIEKFCNIFNFSVLYSLSFHFTLNCNELGWKVFTVKSLQSFQQSYFHSGKKSMITLIVFGGGRGLFFTPYSKILEKGAIFAQWQHCFNKTNFHVWYCLRHDKNLKFQFNIDFFNTKEVKTETWCKKSPLNTINKYL